MTRSRLEPIPVVACVAAVVSGLQVAAGLVKHGRDKSSEPDGNADESSYKTTWRRHQRNRILRRRILLIAYEIKVAYLVCPNLVRRFSASSPLKLGALNYGEDDHFREQMELVRVDVQTLRVDMTEAEDIPAMDALLRQCETIRNGAVESIASYGMRVAQQYGLSGSDLSFRNALEGHLSRRQRKKRRRALRALGLESHVVNNQVLCHLLELTVTS